MERKAEIRWRPRGMVGSRFCSAMAGTEVPLQGSETLVGTIGFNQKEGYVQLFDMVANKEYNMIWIRDGFCCFIIFFFLAYFLDK